MGEQVPYNTILKLVTCRKIFGILSAVEEIKEEPNL
jgi:hypothetical protein